MQVYKSIAQGNDGSLGAVLYARLGEDFAGEFPYHALGEVELFGDNGIGNSVGEQF